MYKLMVTYMGKDEFYCYDTWESFLAARRFFLQIDGAVVTIGPERSLAG